MDPNSGSVIFNKYAELNPDNTTTNEKAKKLLDSEKLMYFVVNNIENPPLLKKEKRPKQLVKNGKFSYSFTFFFFFILLNFFFFFFHSANFFFIFNFWAVDAGGIFKTDGEISKKKRALEKDLVKYDFFFYFF